MIKPQAELHRHLDVSARTSTLHALAQEQGAISKDISLDQFHEQIVLRAPRSDLAEVLGTFQLFQKVLTTPKAIERIAFEGVEDCVKEGTNLIEFRYSPAFLSEFSNLPWQDALDAVEAGFRRALKQYKGVRVGLIGIISREYGIPGAEKTLSFLLKNQTKFIGLDLAGDEKQSETKMFRPYFEEAKRKGFRITVHAGEGTTADHVWGAIEHLGAERIGHGVASVQDPKLLNYLMKSGVCLEICPTSNWLTRAVPSLKEHPLPLFLRAGVPVSINTDDPGVFATTIGDEYSVCQKQMGLSQADLETCKKNAIKYSFVEKSVARPFD